MSFKGKLPALVMQEISVEEQVYDREVAKHKQVGDDVMDCWLVDFEIALHDHESFESIVISS